MAAKIVDTPLAVLKWSFFGLLLSVGLIIAAYTLRDSPALSNPLVAVGGLGSIAAGFAYLISLGVCASRLGRSWIVWCGLTIITSPLGYLFAYPMMQSRANEAR